jgi:hypothetical protein
VEAGVIDKAKAEGIALLRSDLSAFELTGKLYALLSKEGQ